MPVQNEALLEAYASCPPSARVYFTLEIWQLGDHLCHHQRQFLIHAAIHN